MRFLIFEISKGDEERVRTSLFRCHHRHPLTALDYASIPFISSNSLHFTFNQFCFHFHHFSFSIAFGMDWDRTGGWVFSPHILIVVRLGVADIWDPWVSTELDMENLISLVNRLQRACTALGDHGEESALPTLWDALPSIAVVGGQVIGIYVSIPICVCDDYLFELVNRFLSISLQITIDFIVDVYSIFACIECDMNSSFNLPVFFFHFVYIFMFCSKIFSQHLFIKCIVSLNVNVSIYIVLISLYIIWLDVITSLALANPYKFTSLSCRL